MFESVVRFFIICTLFLMLWYSMGTITAYFWFRFKEWRFKRK